MVPVPFPRLSLWQSAVDEVVAKRHPGRRPATDNRMVRSASAHVLGLHPGVPMLGRRKDVAGNAALGFDAAYCSTIAFKLAEARLFGDRAAADRYRQELTNKFTICDTG